MHFKNDLPHDVGIRLREIMAKKVKEFRVYSMLILIFISIPRVICRKTLDIFE